MGLAVIGAGVALGRDAGELGRGNLHRFAAGHGFIVILYHLVIHGILAHIGICGVVIAVLRAVGGVGNRRPRIRLYGDGVGLAVIHTGVALGRDGEFT